MKTIALRRLAEINPPTPYFDHVPDGERVLFLPLETVWADGRADQARRVPKIQVSSGYTRFHAGDIVSPKVTPTFQAGRTMIAEATGAGTTELHVLRARPSVDPRWVAYALRSKHFLREGVTAFEGVAGLQRVPQRFLEEFRVADVPGDEQRRIADFLDDRVARLDQVVASRRAQIAMLRDSFTSFQINAVAGALPGYPCHSSDGQWFPWRGEGVGLVKFSRVATLQRGVDLTAEEQVLGVHPVVTTAGVAGWHSQFVAKGPGVVIGRYGSVGNVHWVDRDFWPHNTTLYVKDPLGNDLRWVYYLLRVFPYSAMQARSAVPGVNRNNMATETVPLPPVSLQREIVKVLDDRVERDEHLLFGLERSIALVNEYKQSLITAAVTGEFDVTTASTRIPGEHA